MSTLSNARRPLATAHRLIHDGDPKAFRRYIHNLYETDKFGLAEAGEMLYEYTCKYGADFVKSLLETAKADTEALSLVRFLSDYFFPRFPLTADNRRLLQRVYLLHKNLAVAVYDNIRSRSAGEVAFAACSNYADFQDSSTSVGRISMIAARTRAAEIMEELTQQYNDDNLLTLLVYAYRSISDYYAEASDKKSRDSALQYSRKALELSRRLYAETPDADTRSLLAFAKEDTADLLQDTVMFKQAEILYERALELRKIDVNNGEDRQLAYAWTCCKLANFHTTRRGTGRRDKAIALYEQAAEIFKTLNSDLPNLQQDYAYCRKALGDLYALSDKVKDIITAFDHYKAAAALHLRTLHLLTPIDYADCRYPMALTLWRVGGDNNLNTALEIMHELTDLREVNPELHEFDSRIYFLTYALEDRLWLRHPPARQHPEFHSAYEHACGCGEILEILGYLPAKYREQLSCKELTALRLDALPFYKKHIDPTVPLKQQELTQTAADWVTDFMKQVK